MRKTSITLAVLMLMSGCESIQNGTVVIEKRLACTITNDKLYVVSAYGPVEITGTIAEQDRALICPPPIPKQPASAPKN